METATGTSEVAVRATNVGHGHVFPRADGTTMGCGGPGVCPSCALDLTRKLAGLNPVPAPDKCDNCSTPRGTGYLLQRGNQFLCAACANQFDHLEAKAVLEVGRAEYTGPCQVVGCHRRATKGFMCDECRAAGAVPLQGTAAGGPAIVGTPLVPFVLSQPCMPAPTSVGLTAPQPPPQPAGGPAIWDLVIEDMHARDQYGEKKYGQRLRADDKRDNLIDAYQEVLDLAVYLRKEIYKRTGK